MTHAEVIEECRLFFKTISAEPSEKKRRRADLVYWVYMKWCLLNNREQMNRELFGRGTSKLYRTSRTLGNNAFYYVDCDLLNLKYEDKVALKEYQKEETQWRRDQLKKKRAIQKRRKTIKEKRRQLRNEKKLATPDSTNPSSPELSKSITTSTTSTN